MDAQALFLEWRWIGPCLIGAIVCGAPVEVQSDPGHPAPATVKVLADVVPEVVGDAIGGTATSTHLLPGYGVGDAARSVLDLAAPSPSDLAEVLGAKEDIVTTSRSRIQQIDREIPRVLAEYESGRTTLTLRPEDATAYEERITRLLVSRDGLIRNWLPDLESTLPRGRCSGPDCRAREMLRAVEQRVLATQESRIQRMNSAMDRLKAQHQLEQELDALVNEQVENLDSRLAAVNDQFEARWHEISQHLVVALESEKDASRRAFLGDLVKTAGYFMNSRDAQGMECMSQLISDSSTNSPACASLMQDALTRKAKNYSRGEGETCARCTTCWQEARRRECHQNYGNPAANTEMQSRLTMCFFAISRSCD